MLFADLTYQLWKKIGALSSQNILMTPTVIVSLKKVTYNSIFQLIETFHPSNCTTVNLFFKNNAAAASIISDYKNFVGSNFRSFNAHIITVLFQKMNLASENGQFFLKNPALQKPTTIVYKAKIYFSRNFFNVTLLAFHSHIN